MRTIAYVVVCTISIVALANAQCVVGQNQPPPFYSGFSPNAWPRFATSGLQVMYYGDYGGLTCGQSGCYYDPFGSMEDPAWTAIANWNSASNNSGAHFSTWQSDVPPDNSDPAARLRGYYIPFAELQMVHPEDVNNDSAISAFGWVDYCMDYPGCSNFGLLSEFTSINDTITLADFMTSTVAHEIGHAFALDDCDTCYIGSTVMTALDLNTPGEATAPTFCDNQMVNQTAYP